MFDRPVATELVAKDMLKLKGYTANPFMYALVLYHAFDNDDDGDRESLMKEIVNDPQCMKVLSDLILVNKLNLQKLPTWPFDFILYGSAAHTMYSYLMDVAYLAAICYLKCNDFRNRINKELEKVLKKIKRHLEDSLYAIPYEQRYNIGFLPYMWWVSQSLDVPLDNLFVRADNLQVLRKINARESRLYFNTGALYDLLCESMAPQLNVEWIRGIYVFYAEKEDSKLQYTDMPERMEVAIDSFYTAVEGLYLGNEKIKRVDRWEHYPDLHTADEILDAVQEKNKMTKSVKMNEKKEVFINVPDRFKSRMNLIDENTAEIKNEFLQEMKKIDIVAEYRFILGEVALIESTQFLTRLYNIVSELKLRVESIHLRKSEEEARKQNNKLTAEINKLNKQLSMADETIAKLQAEVTDLTKKLEETDISSTLEQVEMANLEINAMVSQQAEDMETIKRLRAKINKYREKLTEYVEKSEGNEGVDEAEDTTIFEKLADSLHGSNRRLLILGGGELWQSNFKQRVDAIKLFDSSSILVLPPIIKSIDVIQKDDILLLITWHLSHSVDYAAVHKAQTLKCIFSYVANTNFEKIMEIAYNTSRGIINSYKKD